MNNLFGWAVSQNLLITGFKWVGNMSNLNKDFLWICNEDSDEGYFLEVDVQYLEMLHERHNDLPFLPQKIKIEKLKTF